MAPTSQRERFRSVQLVPLTAFDDQGRLNLDPMRALIERVFAAGIRVFIPCAGSAEFHSLSSAEILAVIEMVRDVVGQEGTIVAPVGLQLEQALKLGRDAKAAGADAVLVMPLTFPYLSNEGAGDYYRAILDGVGLPVQIYKKADIPSDELLLELADHPNLVGVKYAVNDLDALRQVIQKDNDRIDWYCGSAERYAPYYALAGSPGYTSGAANLCPRISLAMHAALTSGDWEEAMRLQAFLLPIEHYRARAANSFNITFLKQAIKQTGLDFGETRPPQRRLRAEEMREIDAMIPSILAAEEELAAAPA